MKSLRVFGSHLTRRQRWVYGGVTVYFLAVLAAMCWPLATVFSRVRPLVLGMPFALFCLAALIVLSFLVLLGLFVWEGRPGEGGTGAEIGEDD